MSFPFCERYRPTELSEVLGMKDKSTLIQDIIDNPKDMPNLLFYGPQGTGKTTLVKILLKDLQPIDVLRINGSDTTGVDTIRDKVYNFAISMSSVKNKPKIVWIEEFDFMSASAFAALRSMIEQYLKNTRYVCTCNYLHKVPAPIQSRFSLVEFKKINPAEMLTRLDTVCAIEKITVEKEVLAEIVKSSNGDMRTALNIIQKLSKDGHITKESVASIDNLGATVFALINDGSWSKLRTEIPKLNPDYTNLLVELENIIYNSDLPIAKKATATEVIANSLYEMTSCFDMDIAFAACCSRLIKVIK